MMDTKFCENTKKYLIAYFKKVNFISRSKIQKHNQIKCSSECSLLPNKGTRRAGNTCLVVLSSKNPIYQAITAKKKKKLKGVGGCHL